MEKEKENELAILTLTPLHQHKDKGTGIRAAEVNVRMIGMITGFYFLSLLTGSSKKTMEVLPVNSY